MNIEKLYFEFKDNLKGIDRELWESTSGHRKWCCESFAEFALNQFLEGRWGRIISNKETYTEALTEMGRRKNEHPMVYYWYNRLINAKKGRWGMRLI